MGGNCPPWEALYTSKYIYRRELVTGEMGARRQREELQEEKRGRQYTKAAHLHCAPYNGVFLPSVRGVHFLLPFVSRKRNVSCVYYDNMIATVTWISKETRQKD